MLLTLRILAWRGRGLVALAAVGALALLVAHAAAPPAPRTQAVVVTARAVPAGTTLTDADLRVVRLPSDLVPDSTVPDPGALRGRVLASALPRGLPVAAGALTAGRFAVAPPAGSAVVSLAVDPGLLTPGDRVDLVAAGCDVGLLDGSGSPDGRAVAEAALVLDVTDGTATVALDPAAGRSVVAASGSCTLRALLRT